MSQGTLEIRPLLIVLFLGSEIFRPLRELNQLHHQGLLAMFALLDDQPDIVDPAKYSTAQKAAPAPIAPSVRFENVTFGYAGEWSDRGPEGQRARGPEGQTLGRLQPALQDVSFEVTADQTLAIVGRSGAGKTTASLCIRYQEKSSIATL